jgi:hypothetical protein
MAKLTLNAVNAGFQSNTAVNTNNALIEAAIENTLSLDGTLPNAMNANLDMNSNRILNLPLPLNDNEAARLADVKASLAGGEAYLITNTPAGDIVATNVQAALDELDTKKTAVVTLATSSGSSLVGANDANGGSLYNTVQGFIDYLKSSLGHTLVGGGVGALPLTAAGMWPATTNGCAAATQNETPTNKVNEWTLAFNSSTLQYCEASGVMPSDYDGGTVTATFYWAANDTTANSVVWGIQGICIGDGVAMDTAWGVAQEVTDSNASVAYQLRKSVATAAITLGGAPAANEKVNFRIYRNAPAAGDTLTVDALLLSVMIQFTRV